MIDEKAYITFIATREEESPLTPYGHKYFREIIEAYEAAKQQPGDVVESLRMAESLLQFVKARPEGNVYGYVTSAILENKAAISAMNMGDESGLAATQLGNKNGLNTEPSSSSPATTQKENDE